MVGLLVFWLVYPGTYGLEVLLLALVFEILLVDSLRITVTGTGERATLAGIVRLVEQAQTSRSRAQAIADRAAFWRTLVALGAGALTFAGWLAVGAEPAYAVERLVTALVIACPHALGLAVPFRFRRL
jgi:Cu2+-exporting ATPase